MRIRSQSGLTLLECVILVIIIGIVAALLLPPIHGTSCSRVTFCSSNLKSLWGSQLNYGNQYGRPNGIMPTETGSAFWLKLQKSPKPLIDRYEPFFCPLVSEEVGPGRTSYRGPALPLSDHPELDPVGADKEGNHGEGEGGNVITRLGDIRSVEEDDVLWIRAKTTTKE